MNRRTLLRTAGATVLAVAAGCTEAVQDTVGGRSVEEIKEDAETIPYEELYRNISEYEGQAVYYGNLHITDIVSGQDTKEYLLMFDGGGFNDDRVLYGLWDGDPFRANDDVELWGVVEGLTSYQSLTGEKTVPEISIEAMNVR